MTESVARALARGVELVERTRTAARGGGSETDAGAGPGGEEALILR